MDKKEEWNFKVIDIDAPYYGKIGCGIFSQEEQSCMLTFRDGVELKYKSNQIQKISSKASPGYMGG